MYICYCDIIPKNNFSKNSSKKKDRLYNRTLKDCIYMKCKKISFLYFFLKYIIYYLDKYYSATIITHVPAIRKFYRNMSNSHRKISPRMWVAYVANEKYKQPEEKLCIRLLNVNIFAISTLSVPSLYLLREKSEFFMDRIYSKTNTSGIFAWANFMSLTILYTNRNNFHAYLKLHNVFFLLLIFV